MSSTLESLKRVSHRVEQSVLETVGSATRTQLQPELLARIAMVEDLKTNIETVLAAMEKYIPHDHRLISSFTASSHPADTVAFAMKDFAKSAEKWPQNGQNEYCIQMFLCAEEVFKTLSRSERTYVESAAIHFLAPMKQFLEADMKKFEHEKKLLLTLRVEMDFARNKASKQENEQNILEATRATAEFTKQKEMLEEEISNMESKLSVVRRSLATYIDDLSRHLRSSLEATEKLQKIMEQQLNHEKTSNNSTLRE